MLKTIIEVILALATAIGGIAAIDYFCDVCVKNFFWNHSSLFIYGLIISIALLIIVVTTVYFLRKWQLNQYDIEEPEGQVPLNSPFYIERPPIEADCYRTILKPDALIRIKAPRQMGKSSLMTRILHHAHQHDSRTICISLEEAESTVFTNLDQFLQWLCQTVTDQLELPPEKFADFWQNSTLNIKRRCGKYFEKHLFTEITQPLVLGLDEVDRVFDTTIATDFLGSCEPGTKKVNTTKHGKTSASSSPTRKKSIFPLTSTNPRSTSASPLNYPNLTANKYKPYSNAIN